MVNLKVAAGITQTKKLNT